MPTAAIRSVQMARGRLHFAGSHRGSRSKNRSTLVGTAFAETESLEGVEDCGVEWTSSVTQVGLPTGLNHETTRVAESTSSESSSIYFDSLRDGTSDLTGDSVRDGSSRWIR